MGIAAAKPWIDFGHIPGIPDQKQVDVDHPAKAHGLGKTLQKGKQRLILDGNRLIRFPGPHFQLFLDENGNPTNGNKNNYLYTGENYWTISPYNYTNSNGNCVAIIYIGGNIGMYMIINNDAGIRPVINLRSDVEITGSGTTSDPFKVVGAS